MGQHLLPGTPPVELTLRRSARARRISLRVSGLDGKVTLTLPRGVPEREALAFAEDRADWLRAQLGRQAEQIRVAPGAMLPVEGRNLRITPGAGRRVLVQGDSLMVPQRGAALAGRVRSWLKTLARERLAEASDRYASDLGLAYTRLTLRDTRSRWGSCTSNGGLMFSWRLVMAPPEVLGYVAAHEVAHLAEMNHSPAFWSVVGGLLPGYEAPRGWLRENGTGLHRYRFDD